MKIVLRYALSAAIALGALILLVIMMARGAPDRAILDMLNGMPLLFILINWVMPNEPRPWSWASKVPVYILCTYCIWLYFSLSSTDKRYPGGVLILGIMVWLCDQAYKKWWSSFSPMTRLVVGTVVVTTIVLASIFAVIAVVAAMGITWHGMVSNWGLTLVILYLPLFLGVWFLRQILDKRKPEGKL